MNSVKRKKHPPFAAVLLADIVVAGFILCVFAMFHHALPALAAYMPEPVQPAAVTAVPAENEEQEEAEPFRIPIPQDWRTKFADKFTAETVITESSYSSPNVSITVTRTEGTVGVPEPRPIIYYVADIYVASPDCLTAAVAYDRLEYYSKTDAVDMDLKAGAILSLSGDFFSYQTEGFMVRNGEIYRDDSNYNTVLVMYADGSMEILDAGWYDIRAVEERGVLQVWSFGPSLLTEEGKAYSPSLSYTVDMRNPRSAIGYYEPGHYCFVMVEGRNDAVSWGMTLPQLSQLFEDLGCRIAYNLDGGGSAQIIFNHGRLNAMSNGFREISDIICVVDR